MFLQVEQGIQWVNKGQDFLSIIYFIHWKLIESWKVVIKGACWRREELK